MYDLINDLKNESSTNKKIEILQSYSDSGFVKEALQLTYDPFTRFYINKISNRKRKDIIYTDFNEAFMTFKNIVKDLSERKITGNLAIETVHIFLDGCSDELREVFSLILKKDLKVGISIKSLQKAFGENFIEDFNVQLAHTYDETKNYKKDFWYASPKLDGLRCYFTHGKLLTRNGHEIMGFDHIINELNGIVERYDLDFVDGELYSKEVNFQEIQGAVMSNKNINPERKSKIKYNIFAIGNKKFKNTKDMISLKKEIFNKNLFEYLVLIEDTFIPNLPEPIKTLCEHYMSMGYEGIMLRDTEKWYDWKRSNALLKYKLFKEADFKIIGFNEGEKGTKYEGTLGTIIVSGKYDNNDGRILYIKSEVGSGFSDEFRNEIWNKQKEYLHKIVEIKFQNITDVPDENGTFSLRFPVFLKTKEDR